MIGKKENILEKLMKRNIKPSHHRMKVLEYLIDNRNHPTVEQIFASLKKDLPTLSKATIYNTLNLFVETKLVRAITIEDQETRYDITIENHGHFKCESCGNVYDFIIDIDSFSADDLKGFQINAKDVYFKGICKSCLEQR